MQAVFSFVAFVVLIVFSGVCGWSLYVRFMPGLEYCIIIQRFFRLVIVILSETENKQNPDNNCHENYGKLAPKKTFRIRIVMLSFFLNFGFKTG